MIQSIRSGRNERAVSPVVGVMLMLVVVVIIAAVVSGYSGSLVGTGAAKKAPTLAMDVKVINTGDWHGSGFFATVTGVSEPIPTKDLRIVTSWKARQRYSGGGQNVGPSITGGSTVVPNGSSNVNVLFTPLDQLGGIHAAPFGTGPGVNGTESVDITRTLSAPGQQFGNYTLMQGTTLSARPIGAADSTSLGSSGQGNSFGGYGASNVSYQYWVPEVTTTTEDTTACYGWGGDSYVVWLTGDTCAETLIGWGLTQGTGPDGDPSKFYVVVQPGTTTTTPGYYQSVAETTGKKYLYTKCGDSCIDPVKTVLGTTWNNLNWGDTVNVKVIHIPTGKVIFQQDVPVTE